MKGPLVCREDGLRRGGYGHRIARRQHAHGSGLGRRRLVVERTFAWLRRFRRLATCYERRHEVHDALLGLGCCLICRRRLTRESF